MNKNSSLFDPNATATADSGIFGLPFTEENSRIVILPVPWEVTTSYGGGTARGPQAVLRASRQVDLFDIETGSSYREGIFMREEPAEIEKLGREMKQVAEKTVAAIEDGLENDPKTVALQGQVNDASRTLNDWVYEESKKIFSGGRIPAVLGGDHSTPFGLIRAAKEKFGNEFGILHFDAHADLRDAYQGFTDSHASIMYNVMERIAPQQLVQVGIRDFSEGEHEYIQKNPNHIHTYFDRPLKRRLQKGESWQKICEEIVSHLPKNVHISFDIDGLSPDLCPGTGTPVPGGLSLDQAFTVFAVLAESGRKIVSFDLNEVAEQENSENEWDANVGARVLFKLCGWAVKSNGQQK